MWKYQDYTKTPPKKPELVKRYIVQPEDVGAHSLSIFASNGDREYINLSDVCGYIQSHDVGKMLIKRGDAWKMENDEQLKARLNSK